MEGCDHLQELWRTPNSFQKGKETVSAHQVEGLGQVDEGKVKWASLFAALLLKLSEGEYHVDCRSLCTEPALRLWVNAVSQQLQFAKHDASKGLSYDAEKGYPACPGVSRPPPSIGAGDRAGGREENSHLLA